MQPFMRNEAVNIIQEGPIEKGFQDKTPVMLYWQTRS